MLNIPDHQNRLTLSALFLLINHFLPSVCLSLCKGALHSVVLWCSGWHCCLIARRKVVLNLLVGGGLSSPSVYSSILPQSKDMHIWVIGDSTLTVGVNAT